MKTTYVESSALVSDFCLAGAAFAARLGGKAAGIAEIDDI
jgi:hypothetical protein